MSLNSAAGSVIGALASCWIGVMLEREGITMNHKKLRRLYREEKLQVRKRGGRKRALARDGR